jgi:hypothetical protein
MHIGINGKERKRGKHDVPPLRLFICKVPIYYLGISVFRDTAIHSVISPRCS